MPEPNDAAALLGRGNAQSLRLIESLCQTAEGRRTLAYHIGTLMRLLRQYESLLTPLSHEGAALRAQGALQRRIFDELVREQARPKEEESSCVSSPGARAIIGLASPSVLWPYGSSGS